MSDEHSVVSLLIDANPVPDPERLETVEVGEPAPLMDPQRRRHEVINPEQQEKGSKKQNGFWMAAAVVALIVVGGIALLNIGDGGEDSVLDQPTDTTLAESAPTTTAAPETTSPSEDPGASQLADVETVLAALYSDATAFNAANWANETPHRAALFFHEYGLQIDGTLESHECTVGLDRISCDLVSTDSVSRQIDPEAAYEDMATFIFSTNNEIINVVWTVGSVPSLDAFLIWASEASSEISQTGICDPNDSLGDGAACAQAHLAIVDEYLASLEG